MARPLRQVADASGVAQGQRGCLGGTYAPVDAGRRAFTEDAGVEADQGVKIGPRSN